MEYKTYKSPYGPNYKIQPNFRGITLRQVTRFGLKAAGFGAVAGVTAVYYLSGVPRLQKDILQKIPLLGGYFVHEIPPSDNPF